MGGEAYEPQLASLLCCRESFHGALGAENLLEIGHLRERVKLVEVDVVSAQQPQRLFEQPAQPSLLQSSSLQARNTL